MKKTLYKEIIFAFLMILFITLSYLFIDTGLNAGTKLNINYQEKSISHYELKLLDNDIYDLDIKNNDWNILSNLLDNIKLYFDYKITFSDYATGYYKYKTTIKEILFKDKEIISEKILSSNDEKVSLLDKENIILINDYIDINYDYYKKEYEETKKKYDINPDANLIIEINIYEYISFNKKEEDTPIESKISFEIPLSEEIVKIKAKNINNTSKIDGFSNREKMNYLLILIGLILLSLGITFMISVIKTIKKIYSREKNYKEKLKEILTKNNEKIINVKKIVNVKDYNLIYVKSFNELLDVYKQYKTPICFKETIKKQEAIFLIINEDKAWIYKLDNF